MGEEGNKWTQAARTHTRPQLAVERLVAVIGMFYQISIKLQNK